MTAPAAPGAALVEYAQGDDASAFALMLGGLIEANISRPEKRADFDRLKAAVGVMVTDIDEAVTLEFAGGSLLVHNGLQPGRRLTIRADADTVMTLSNLAILPLVGLPNYTDAVGRDVLGRLAGGRLKIDGMLGHVATLNRVTRLFSVR